MRAKTSTILALVITTAFFAASAYLGWDANDTTGILAAIVTYALFVAVILYKGNKKRQAERVIDEWHRMMTGRPLALVDGSNVLQMDPKRPDGCHLANCIDSLVDMGYRPQIVTDYGTRHARGAASEPIFEWMIARGIWSEMNQGWEADHWVVENWAPGRVMVTGDLYRDRVDAYPNVIKEEHFLRPAYKNGEFTFTRYNHSQYERPINA